MEGVNVIKIQFSEHAKLKLKERNIDKTEILDILKTPTTVFLDAETGNFIAIGKRTHKPQHQLIIAYTIRGNIIRVITVIDVSKGENIIKRREAKGRWVKIK